MRRPILTIFLIGVLAFGAVFLAAPWFAFRALRSAAKANDIQAMAELIDFNAVRQNLNGQTNPEAAAPAPDLWHDPIGAVRHVFQPMQPTADTDAYLTPQSIADLSAGETGANPSAPSSRLSDLVPGAQGRSINYWDPNRFRVQVTNQDGRTTLFSFERRGLLDWKLVQMRLPGRPDAGQPNPGQPPKS